MDLAVIGDPAKLRQHFGLVRRAYMKVNKVCSISAFLLYEFSQLECISTFLLFRFQGRPVQPNQAATNDGTSNKQSSNDAPKRRPQRRHAP